jgi:predicted small metal-binding protein
MYSYTAGGHPHIKNQEVTMVSFRCSDIGVDCQCELTGETQPELARIITAHIHDIHQADPISPNMLLKIKNAIRP